MALSPAETILAVARPIRPLRHARSTILLGSIAVIRSGGRWSDYVAALPPSMHPLLLEAVAATWIPIDAALAHYRACDTLGLSVDEQLENGRKTFDRAGGTVFGTVMKMAREVGVTPWTLFPQMQRFWERGYDGGAVGITKTGPKEARLETYEVPLCQSRYYRTALRGLVTGVIGLFCRKAYLSELPQPRGQDSLAFRAQWV